MSHEGQGSVKPHVAEDKASETPCPVANGLAVLLADTYTLSLKTLNYHWNVTGSMFHTLHLMFEGQYDELALAADEIAERIRALGAHAPASYGEFARHTGIRDDPDQPGATEMVRSAPGRSGRRDPDREVDLPARAGRPR